MFIEIVEILDTFFLFGLLIGLIVVVVSNVVCSVITSSALKHINLPYFSKLKIIFLLPFFRFWAQKNFPQDKEIYFKKIALSERVRWSVVIMMLLYCFGVYIYGAYLLEHRSGL